MVRVAGSSFDQPANEVDLAMFEIGRPQLRVEAGGDRRGGGDARVATAREVDPHARVPGRAHVLDQRERRFGRIPRTSGKPGAAWGNELAERLDVSLGCHAGALPGSRRADDRRRAELADALERGRLAEEPARRREDLP